METTSSFRVTEFATARAHELALLREQVKCLGGRKQVFQSLPWHLRRRTMSHQSRRLPRKWKIKTQDIDNRPSIGKNKCRKYRRKAKYLRENLKKRLTRQDRLETHLWFAKRFHRKQYFGYQVPWCSVDRKERSAYRAMRDRVVVYDASLVDWVLVEDKQSNILEGLEKVVREKEKPILREPLFLLGKAVLHTFLQGDDDHPTETSIVQVLLAPRNVSNDDDICKALVCTQFLGYHQVRESVIRSMFGNTARTKPLMMNRFHAIGPKSLTMIRRCFQWIQEDWKNVQDNAVDDATTPLYILRCWIPQGFHMGFPHFCASSRIETSPPSLDWLEDMEKWTASSSISNVAKTDIHLTVILIPRALVTSSGKSVGKWDILVPSGFGSSFLHAARHMGAQVVGWKEYRRIFFECEKLHFPEDFPQSFLYKDAATMNTFENLQQFVKKPPAKRGTNLLPFSVFPTLWNQLGKTPSELVSVWNAVKNLLLQMVEQGSLDNGLTFMQQLKTHSYWSDNVLWTNTSLTNTDEKSLVPVFIQLIGKGCSSIGAPLFVPGEQDIPMFRKTKNLQLSKGQERKLVGYVTQASYSFANGCFCGIGYISSVYQPREKWNSVIIPRTTKCTDFIPAKCRQLKSNLIFDF
ncbi:hypothetical protein GAYE_PCTG70G1486 [Galdieria yellowstonensis]|uniref:Uncharacterized protein n=1 Tax=Galdieria yellowstonensis TaxID=3028027 RepID=A0AAV9I8A1_9RHOD|nr:hypothetical protein GAYE_PCTG70G1486 [Galdieria yellowstonensis]